MNRTKKRKSPWDRDPVRKRELVTKLEAIEKRYDFYSGLYRQYTTDLLKLCIYVRKLVANKRASTSRKNRQKFCSDSKAFCVRLDGQSR